MSVWDCARLKIASCRYTRSTKTDDIVIAAHNYARHFGSISSLEPGAEVHFVDIDSVIFAYEVEKVGILALPPWRDDIGRL